MRPAVGGSSKEGVQGDEAASGLLRTSGQLQAGATNGTRRPPCSTLPCSLIRLGGHRQGSQPPKDSLSRVTLLPTAHHSHPTPCLFIHELPKSDWPPPPLTCFSELTVTKGSMARWKVFWLQSQADLDFKSRMTWNMSN